MNDMVWIFLFVGFLLSEDLVSDVPRGAVLEAQRKLASELNRAQNDPQWFFSKWEIEASQIDLDSITLAEPYLIYTMSYDDICWYAEFGEGSDVLTFARIMYYAFPMVSEGTWIGTLHVAYNRDENGEIIIEEMGEYVAGGAVISGPYGEPILQLREQFPKEHGYRIRELHTTKIGIYYLITSKNGETYVAPYGKVSRQALGVPGGALEHKPIPMEQAAPLLKEQAERFSYRYRNR